VDGGLRLIDREAVGSHENFYRDLKLAFCLLDAGGDDAIFLV